MPFIFITFFTAFLIEALGTIIGVQGFSKLLGFEFVIIALVIAFDIGKLTTVTLLYRHWKNLGIAMRSYGLIAIFVTMLISSAGAFAYLSGKFQTSIIGTQEGALKVSVLKEQQLKYEERKKQIDAQIAALPEKTTVNQRLRLINGFKAEQTDLQNKISEIDKELPSLQVKQISTEAEAGPILYVAKAFDVPVEVAVKYVIGLIITVFNPLAVFLVIAGNFLLNDRKKNKIVQPVLEENMAQEEPVHVESLEPTIHNEPNPKFITPEDVVPEAQEELELQLQPIEEKTFSEDEPSGPLIQEPEEEITLKQLKQESKSLARSSLEDIDPDYSGVSFQEDSKLTPLGMTYQLNSKT